MDTLNKPTLKQVAGLRYSVEQADQALKSAISFIHGQQAGDVSYGAKSAGCIVTHSSFKERWLRVKWGLTGQLSRFLWDGEVLSIGVEGVSKPRIFGHFDWEAIGICYRAIMMSVARGMISKQHHLDHAPVLEPLWWEKLADAIAKVQAKQTDRVYITYERMAQQLGARFGLKLRPLFPHWQTAHGDLHWANLTAPEFSIIDWETWGQAPYGFDIAHLHAFSVTESAVVSRIKDVFSPVTAKPEYDVTFLYVASELMHAFDLREKYGELQAELRREVEGVLAQRRFADFCE
jgi:hypothetical protein